MGRLVDCDRVYNAIQITTDNFGVVKHVVESNMQTMLSKIPTANAINIPEGATNGDMIKAMFPNELLTSITSTLWWGDNMSFNNDWWNAPYKKESEK